MIEHRKTFFNAAMSLNQVVIQSIVGFIQFSFLVLTLGAEKFGIWIVYLAILTILITISQGIAISLRTYTAKFIGRQNEKEISELIQTGIVTITGIILVLGLFLSVLSFLILSNLSLESDIILLLSNLPLMVISVWFIACSGVFQAGLDGFQLIYKRNIILILTAVIFLILILILVPFYGLIGLIYSFFLQALFSLILAWIFLKKKINNLPILTYRWKKKHFKEILGYSVNVQISSISQMFTDPTTKSLFLVFGGAQIVTFYELARYIIFQVRSLVVSVNEVLVPIISTINEENDQMISKIYRNSINIIFFLSVPLFSYSIVMTPIFSSLMLGEYNKYFIFFLTIFSITWFLNILSVPAFFTYLGLGRLRWITLSSILSVIVNLFLGIVLGGVFGGLGVFYAWNIDILVLSAIIMIPFHIEKNILFRDLFSFHDFLLLVLSILGIVACSVAYLLFSTVHIVLVGILLTMIYFLIVIIPIWIHPVREQILAYLV